MALLIAFAGYGAAMTPAHAASAEVLKLWPDPPPGTADWPATERVRVDTGANGEKELTYGEVSQPTLTVIRPKPGTATGAAMIVMPGGAFMELAWTKEGLQPAAWLADRGVTVFVLKYRVREIPFPSEGELGKLPAAFDKAMVILDPNLRIAIADARQAVRLVREQAKAYGVQPDRVGLMGFSAGATTAMDTVLEADTASRPDFAVVAYGAMKLQPPPRQGPPIFIVAAQDDDIVPIEKSVEIFEAWQRANLSAELHITSTGGHGFGLGRPGTTSFAWPKALEAWMMRRGYARAIDAPTP